MKIKYKCNMCGKIFNQPHESYENQGFQEKPHWEYEYTSPCCGYGFEEIEESKEENTMKYANLTFDELNKALEAAGIVYVDEYEEEECVVLDSIYSWGFVTRAHYMTIDDCITCYDFDGNIMHWFYDDWCKYQKNGTIWRISGSTLFIEYHPVFGGDIWYERYDFSNGAMIKASNVEGVYVCLHEGQFDTERIIKLKDTDNGRLAKAYYYDEGHQDFKGIVELIGVIPERFEKVDEDSWGNNIGSFNSMLMRKDW